MLFAFCSRFLIVFSSAAFESVRVPARLLACVRVCVCVYTCVLAGDRGAWGEGQVMIIALLCVR